MQNVQFYNKNKIHFIYIVWSDFFIVQIIKNNAKQPGKVTISKYSAKRQKVFWIIRISTLAFSLSLLLSLFSETFLNKSNVILAIILLITFMMLNVFSDMLGLAITSCQIEELKKDDISRTLKTRCLLLIKNSDKVSSILCDVIGDISGILCGVSGTTITIILSSTFKIVSLNILFGSIVSAIIAGLTVLFKAIAKNYAVNNSLKLVKSTAKFMEVLENIFKKFKRKKKNKSSENKLNDSNKISNA